MGLLDSLFLDPTAAGGGWLANLLGITPANTTKTPTVGVRNQATGAYTPAALVAQTAMQGGPAPVNPAMSAFSPPQGLLGNSLIANGIRGGLAGLSSSNGYKGFGAQLGAGFEGGVQGNLARQQVMARNALMGQAYQQGQQGLAMGNIGLAQTVARYNVWANMSGRPTITVAQAQSDPNLLAQVMAGSQQSAPSGGAPASNGSTPQPGMSPVYGGGQSVDPNVAASYPPSAQGGAPQQGQPQQGQPGNDPEAGFRQTHGGMSTTDWANYGYQLAAAGDPSGMEMVKEATANNPLVQTQLAHAKSQGTLMNLRSGSTVYDPQAGAVYQNPVKQDVYNPDTGRVETKWVTPAMAGGGAQGGSPGGNNVGNIRSGSGGFRQYPDLGSGINGVVQNLQAYGDKGINTVQGIVSTWAPPSENDTQAYIDNVSKWTGFAPDQKLDMKDPRVLTALTAAIARQEQGAPGGASSSGNLPQGPSKGDENLMKGYTDQRLNFENGTQPTIIGIQRMEAITDALKKFQSGAGADKLAEVNAVFKRLGLQSIDSVDPAQVQIVLKNNFQAAVQQMQKFSSNPAAVSLQSAIDNFANPNLQPEANLAILAQGIGTSRWQLDAIKAMQDAKLSPTSDPNKFFLDWAMKHPIQDYISKEEKNIGSLGGMPQSTAPAVGTVKGGYRFKGGDPSQKANWEQVN